ncbi:MAG: NAD(P)H-dependent glycerol-3-phosphate dehydrogenase [Pseudomonadota bacterium]
MHGRKPVSVLGAGSWGTALAILIARNGHETVLWGHDPAQIETLRTTRINERYLPGVELPDSLRLTSDLASAAYRVRTFLIAVPSHAFNQTLAALKAYFPSNGRIAWATKGFDPASGRLLHEVVGDFFLADTPMAAVSGPTFAREVAANLPTAITVAANQPEFAEDLAHTLRNARFRPYTSTDITGVQVGGAAKNVMAIAAGIADGLGFGANTRAALVTRGLAEIMRLGLALGGKQETFMGLAGLGDLVLTCTDNQSRNRRLGIALGQGKDQAESIQEIGQEVEGVFAAREVYTLARRHGVSMPISEQTYCVLHRGLSPEIAVKNLLEREQKPETD